MYVGVDLAARFSAAVALDEYGEVCFQAGSWGLKPRKFCDELAKSLRTIKDGAGELSLLVEDLPYGLSGQMMVKQPLRVQGIIIAKMGDVDLLDDMYFLAPATWKRHFGLPLRGQTEKQKAQSARDKAAEFGYVAPDLLKEYSDDIPPVGPEHAKERNKIRGQLRKAMTDYDDAYLIARYAYDMRWQDLSKIQGLQRPDL